MSIIEWMNRLRHLGRRARFEEDIDHEIRFHIESRAADLEAAGISRRDSLAQARREFGPVARSAEDSRDAWQFHWLEDMIADLRYALRAFRKCPGFTLTAVLSLALGIGANSAIFTALDAVLWKALPVTDPHSLVYVDISRANGRNSNPPLVLIRQVQASGIFSDLITTGADGLSFSYDDRAERIVCEFVSPNFFTFLGVQPILGQGFTPDVQAGHWAPQAVLSYGFWKRRFGGDPGVIGRTVRLNTYPFTIVGVSPPSFFGLTRGFNYELRIPILPDGQELAQIHEISGSIERSRTTMARLKVGENISRVEAAASAQLQEFLHTTPVQQFRNAGFRQFRLLPGERGASGDLSRFHAPLYLLLALVAIVLLIACANVANMLIARGAARARELAIRTSIGAGRFRLIRQMLSESILLSVLGGTCGIIVANWTAGLLFRFLPQGHMSIVLDLHPDTRALLFTFTLSLLTGILFGLAPALHSTRGDLAATLKCDSMSSIGERRSAMFRKILIASQVAFSLVLVIAAAIFVRTLSDLRATDYGTKPKSVLLFTMKPQQEIYSEDRKRILAAELIRRISQVPGVEAAALAENGPLGSRSSSDSIQAPGQNPVSADIDWVSPGFFDTLRVRRIAGRDFNAGDKPGAPGVTIINQSLARALFKNENPVGRTILFSPGRRARRAFEIVAVVVDTHYYDLHQEPRPTAWFTFQDDAAPYMPTLHVRTALSGTAAVMAAIRHEFDVLDKGFPVFNTKTLEVRIEESLARERMVANIATAFGMLALVLAAVGLYGILAYSVSRRTREIGLRLALGSGAGPILWMVAREALLLVGIGSAAGLAIAIAASRVLTRYLFEVSGAGPGILLLCVTTMLVMAAIAITTPALRACRVDPLDALRHE